MCSMCEYCEYFEICEQEDFETCYLKEKSFDEYLDRQTRDQNFLNWWEK